MLAMVVYWATFVLKVYISVFAVRADMGSALTALTAATDMYASKNQGAQEIAIAGRPAPTVGRLPPQKPIVRLREQALLPQASHTTAPTGAPDHLRSPTPDRARLAREAPSQINGELLTTRNASPS